MNIHFEKVQLKHIDTIFGWLDEHRGLVIKS
jgi:hypothetical protein